MNPYKYLFGPVPSRRFGRSLGIDLVPLKTCTLDCVFCQLGGSPATAAERREFVPTEDVISELRDWLARDGKADYLTLSGSGEPTLHARFGDVLAFLQAESRIPRLLMTNGTLLYLPEVRRAACHATVVKMSLSAWDEESFRRINRASAAIHFERLLAGEKAFRSEFSGEIWLEVFVLQGVNSAPDDMRRIAALAAEIGPDRVQLNSVARPPAEVSAVAPPRETLEELAGLFSPPAEVVAAYSGKAGKEGGTDAEKILAMLKRRPCTSLQIAEVFGIHVNEVAKHLGALLQRDVIRREQTGNQTYFVAR